MKDQTITLEGQGIEIPKFIVRFSGGSTLLSNSIEEIMAIAKKENRQIESMQPVKFDKALFDTTINLIDETKALLNAFYYAVDGEDNHNERYADKFFTFFEMIKAIENKVRETKELYQNNYEMIELAERLVTKKKVA